MPIFEGKGAFKVNISVTFYHKLGGEYFSVKIIFSKKKKKENAKFQGACRHFPFSDLEFENGPNRLYFIVHDCIHLFSFMHLLCWLYTLTEETRDKERARM